MGCIETIYVQNKKLTEYNFKYINGNCEITEVGEENKELERITTNQNNFLIDMQNARDKDSSSDKSV